jgi:hypothetical protein
LGGAKHYGRIAFNPKPEGNMTVFPEKERKAGAFSFAETVYAERDLETCREYFPDKIKGKTERHTVTAPWIFTAEQFITAGRIITAE